MNRNIKIMIVDDDPMVLDSLKLVLEKKEDMVVVATAGNGNEAIGIVDKYQNEQKELPDVILMDIRMPNMDGIEATGQLKKKAPEIRIMMLTTFEDEHNIRRALRAGAEGYLIKSTEISSMAEKIRALLSGSVILDQKALEELTKPKEKIIKSLSPREQDIIRLVGRGYSNKEIAAELFISEGTVRNNLSVILEKLHLRDRTQLVVYYLSNGQPDNS